MNGNGKKTKLPKANVMTSARKDRAGKKGEGQFVYIMVYMKPEQREHIRKAAAQEGMKDSAFVRSAAIHKANGVLGA